MNGNACGPRGFGRVDLLDSVSEDSAAIASLAQDETVTLLSTDVVDSTGLASRLGDIEWAALIMRYQTTMREIAERHDGRVVKTLGDGSMLEFASTRDGVEASVEIQRGLTDEECRLRVGIHSGHALRSENDLLGLTVNS